MRDWNVDLSATDPDGNTAAHIAAQEGRLDILHALRDWNVDLSATTNSGLNAAHFAAEYGHLDILRALQGWNVDLSATDNDGLTNQTSSHPNKSKLSQQDPK